MVRESDRLANRLFFATVVITVLIGAIAYVTSPEPLALALVVLAALCTGAFANPAFGVYSIVFFSLVGDAQTTPWWPFTKNMSSKESIFYVNDALSITPLEVVLGVTLFVLILRVAVDRATSWRWGVMSLALGWLSLFVVAGFMNGFVSGGNQSVALVEVRPLLYLPALYVAITNAFRTRQQYRTAFAVAMVAIAIQSIGALFYYRSLPATERELLEALTEHTASVQVNVLIIFFLALVVFGGVSWHRRAMLVLLVPSMWAYLLSRRRAAMVALFVGLFLLFAVMFVRKRRLFWFVAPAAAFGVVAFVAATWNSSGVLGLPATAVKSVLFVDELSTRDRNSSLYRDLEAYNLWVTIRASPLTGFGFGHPFIVAVPMPDISEYFPDWQYFPHNSVLWVWVKTGFGGFCAMLFLFARSLQRGARTTVGMTSGSDIAMSLAAVTYVLMFIVFAYVDIGWDIRPAVLLALSIAIAADFAGLPERSPEGEALR